MRERAMGLDRTAVDGSVRCRRLCQCRLLASFEDLVSTWDCDAGSRRGFSSLIKRHGN